MHRNEPPYGDCEYQLLVKKLENFCGKMPSKLLFEELSKEVKEYSIKQSTNFWNQESSKRFVDHISESEKWKNSYCATLVVEAVLLELCRSYPKTTFNHISQILLKLTI